MKWEVDRYLTQLFGERKVYYEPSTSVDHEPSQPDVQTYLCSTFEIKNNFSMEKRLDAFSLKLSTFKNTV